MRLYLAENEMAYEVVESLVGSDHARSLVGLSAERFGTLHDRTTGLSRARQASWLHGGFLLRLGGLHGRRFLHLQPINIITSKRTENDLLHHTKIHDIAMHTI